MVPRHPSLLEPGALLTWKDWRVRYWEGVGRVSQQKEQHVQRLRGTGTPEGRGCGAGVLGAGTAPGPQSQEPHPCLLKLEQPSLSSEEATCLGPLVTVGEITGVTEQSLLPPTVPAGVCSRGVSRQHHGVCHRGARHAAHARQRPAHRGPAAAP